MPAWERTIFVLIDNQKLKSELIKWVESRDYKIVWGEPNSPDIIAIGCFASIIDRKLVGKEIYRQYLQLLKETSNIAALLGEAEKSELKDESICIIIDQLKKVELPKLDVVLQIDMKQRNASKWIIQVIDFASKFHGFNYYA